MENETVRIEAEDFTGFGTGGFSAQSISGASGGRVVRTTSHSPSTLDTELPEGVAPGTYSITIWYFDENDGQAPASIAVDGVTVGNWVFDEATSGAGGQIENLRSITFHDVEIGPDSTFSITAMRDLGEYARIDAVDFTRTDDVADPEPEPDTTAPTYDILPVSAVNDPIAPLEIEVRYSDDVAIDTATITPSNLAWGGQEQTADSVTHVTEADGSVLATYTYYAPGGGFVEGEYAISLGADRVTDTSGNALAIDEISSFLVLGAPLTVGFGSSTLELDEEVSGSVSIFLEVSQLVPDGKVLIVDYETSLFSTATPGEDYVAQSGTVSISGNSHYANFELELLDDRELEVAELIRVNITSATMDGVPVELSTSRTFIRIADESGQNGTVGDDFIDVIRQDERINISNGGADEVEGYPSSLHLLTIDGMDVDDTIKIPTITQISDLEWNNTDTTLTVSFTEGGLAPIEIFLENLPNYSLPIDSTDFTSTSDGLDTYIRFAPDGEEIDGGPVGPLGDPITIEVEDFTGISSSGFSVQSAGSASGGAVVRNSNYDFITVDTELADIVDSGTYDIIVTYFDENDGEAPAEALLNGVSLGNWVFNEDTQGSGAQAENIRTITFEGVDISEGSTFSLAGARDRGEYVRFDKVEFVPVGNETPIEMDTVGPSVTLEFARQVLSSDVTAVVSLIVSDPNEVNLSIDLHAARAVDASGNSKSPFAAILSYPGGEDRKVFNFQAPTDGWTEGELTYTIPEGTFTDPWGNPNEEISFTTTVDFSDTLVGTPDNDKFYIQDRHTSVDISSGGDDYVSLFLSEFDGFIITGLNAGDTINVQTQDGWGGFSFDAASSTLNIWGDGNVVSAQLHLEDLPDIGRTITTEDFRLEDEYGNGLNARQIVFDPQESPIDPVDPVDPIDPIDPVDPVDPVDPADPPSPGESFTIEAEAFSGLGNGYEIQNNGDASGGQLVRTYSSGTIETILSEDTAPGIYTITIHYYDENDGTSPVVLSVDGEVIGNWQFDDDGPGAGAQVENLRTISFEGVELDAGSVISLFGTRDGGEYARIDKVEFVAQAPEASSQAVAAPQFSMMKEDLPLNENASDAFDFSAMAAPSADKPETSDFASELVPAIANNEPAPESVVSEVSPQFDNVHTELNDPFVQSESYAGFDFA